MAETINGTYGVSDTLSNATLESVTKTDTHTYEPVPNQKNEVEKEIKVDTRTDIRITARGTKPTGGTLSFGGATYLIDSVEDAGTYNGLKRFTVSAHKYANQTISAS